jgi:type IV pilus assembly protein PilE
MDGSRFVEPISRIRGMTMPSPRAGLPRRQRGFTLIEILIVLVVVALLAAIAYPSYQNMVRKSRRADAVDALSRIQQAQERWRSNNATYAGSALLTSAWPAGLGQSATSPGAYYTLAITANSATGYTLTATAVAGKSQAKDSGCTTMTVTAAAANLTYTPASCWNR